MTAFSRFCCKLNGSQVRLTWFGIGVLIVAVHASAQPRGVKDGEVIERAPAVAPNIYQANAVKRDGAVVIQISSRDMRLQNRDPDNKETKGWIDCWTKMDPLVLGQQIRAYHPSGKKIDEAIVLQALEKPVAVACFQRTHQSDPELPDLFYTRVFRDDLVILVFEAKYWLR